MLKIHGLLFSAHTRKTIVAASEKQIPYELNRVIPDSESGYRYYAAGQLGALNRILVLRDLGFTLDEIARMQRELPPERIAACVRVGLPEQAHLITGKIAQFIAANRHRLAGPSRELFLQRPNLQRLDESIVEMQYPIASVNEPASTE
jgi:DNA-binding transcriptional MerR regulator